VLFSGAVPTRCSHSSSIGPTATISASPDSSASSTTPRSGGRRRRLVATGRSIPTTLVPVPRNAGSMTHLRYVVVRRSGCGDAWIRPVWPLPGLALPIGWVNRRGTPRRASCASAVTVVNSRRRSTEVDEGCLLIAGARSSASSALALVDREASAGAASAAIAVTQERSPRRGATMTAAPRGD